ncbi:MAG: hypothetical protein A07HN63_01243 [uncultured archaeon A07HN63]|nr:MAG: hypothetical protein A07HN63_01243 [uncultured archaeon A07HN63]
MSVSQHPVALTIEQRVGDSARLLATVMALPLLDGLFVALLLAGTLRTPVGMLETGLLVFGGSATVAVILAEMDDEPRSLVGSILLIGAVLIPLAAFEAAIAPLIESAIDMAVFQRFAGVVILAVAAQTASAKLSDLLPNPAIIILLGLIGSLRPEALVVELLLDVELMARAALTAAIGVGFALVVALAAPTLRDVIDIDRFRFGSSVALGVFALPVLGVLQTDAPIALAVLLVSGLLAYRPGSISSDESEASETLLQQAAAVATAGGTAADSSGDGGPSSEEPGTSDYESVQDDTTRAPWL